MELRASKRTGGAMAALGLALMLSVTGAAQAPAVVRLPPKLTHVEPEYPPELTTRTRGAVEVQLTVGTDGRVTDARVTRSMPPFDATVLAAVRQWVFDARRLTAPVTSTVLVTVTPPTGTPRARQGTPDPSTSRDRTAAITGRAAGAGESPQAALRRLNALLASAGTTGDARLQALRERAFLQATTGRTGLAERDIEALLATNPRDVDAYFTRGLAHFASATKTANAAFSTVVELQPAHSTPIGAVPGPTWWPETSPPRGAISIRSYAASRIRRRSADVAGRISTTAATRRPTRISASCFVCRRRIPKRTPRVPRRATWPAASRRHEPT